MCKNFPHKHYSFDDSENYTFHLASKSSFSFLTRLCLVLHEVYTLLLRARGKIMLHAKWALDLNSKTNPCNFEGLGKLSTVAYLNNPVKLF